MSGGFFRGTSADQDTRFSNKQAKLLKSQKFAPELDHLVDMTKVKMDVIKPWIANRVMELLGFEDEVLINFIYGLLDGKEVNGKEVQISLTGFMEKNTGKFMKELWTLLLSAEKNASGVPQQFLDAKEEEMRKKKVEAEWIADEIQKKKERESREFDQERSKKMDGAVETKANDAALDANSKTGLARASGFHPEDEKEAGEQNGVRGRNRVAKSPRSAALSPSPRRGSPSRSISKSHSYSRSSDGRHKSRTLSRSPVAQRHSISSGRMRYSPRRRSITPRKRHSLRISRSPSRKYYFRRRSRSRSVYRSPSPPRRKFHSPYRRRSPSPIRRRRSPSPIRCRRSPSPVRRQLSPSSIRRHLSPSPVRRRLSPSPIRRRRSPLMRRRGSPSLVRRRGSPSSLRRRGSPSPVRRRGSPLSMRHRLPSPMQHSSPSSPTRRWSLSPMRRGALSPKRRASPSPVRRQYQRSPSTPLDSSPSPIGHRSPLPGCLRSPIPHKHRSPTSDESSSPSPNQRGTSSPVRKKSASDSRRSPVHSPTEKNRFHEKSPAAHRSVSSLRSPHRDSKDREDIHHKVSTFSPSPERSPTVSKSPLCATRKGSASDDQRSFSPNGSPERQTRDGVRDDSSSPLKTREHRPHQDGLETCKELKDTSRAREDLEHKSVLLPRRSVHSSTASRRKDSPAKVRNDEEYSPERSVDGHYATESRIRHDSLDSMKKDQGLKIERLSQRGDHPGTSDHQRSPTLYNRQLSSYPGESQKSGERNHSRSNNGKNSHRQHKYEDVRMAVERADRNDTMDSSSEESDRHRTENKGKRKDKKHGREEVASDDDYSYDSEIERKEAKRRRKEEKKLRKEEKRRRRDERRRRREERRAEKLKLRNQSDADASDGEHVSRRESHLSDNEEAESEQKKLEIELRNKALESIKAKKKSNH